MEEDSGGAPAEAEDSGEPAAPEGAAEKVVSLSPFKVSAKDHKDKEKEDDDPSDA